MAPRMRIHENSTARTRAVRAKYKQAGKKQISMWLSADAVARLDEMAKAQGVVRAAVVEAMLMEDEK